MDITCQNREKRIQKSLETELVGAAGGIALQHFDDDLFQLCAIPALKDQLLAVKSQILKIFPGILTGKADPQIGPGLLLVGLVEGLDLGFDQKTLACLQLILPVAYIVPAPALQNKVQKVVGTYRRTKAMKGFAFGISAEAQIKVAELVTG